ncbi:MAG: alpha-L-fucosidase [Acidobacteriota bacterium]|nr:MAG: alpha-L-fucosidase [Acidobacteriota bacterium]
MFIHWGPVSLAGTEIGWSRGREVPETAYDQLYKRFNPTEFNAEEWVKIARDAGMKYIVITSKHHDGFAIWDSKVSDYDIMATPFGRDILRELSDACRKYGISFSTYHSICDWYHPDYPLGSPGGKTQKVSSNMDRYREFLKAQLREIIEGYGPLGIMWFDGEWESPWTHEDGLDLYAYVRSLQPDILINNRVDKGREGMKGITISDEYAGDYDTPEQEVGAFNRERPWESCITIGEQWAWKPSDRLKSAAESLRTLLQTVGGDGNLLYNVGPMPDGRIEPRQVETLKTMGQWLDQFGEGVYGTRGGPYKPGAWGASTCKGGDIYLYIWEWGEDGQLQLPGLDTAILSHEVLSSGPVTLENSDEGLRITASVDTAEEIATVIRLKVQGDALEIEPREVADH